MKLSLGYITVGNKKEAKEIAMDLLAEGLVACVNITPSVESYFVWDDQIMKENELVLIFKTREKNEEEIVRFVKKRHSYECPCIVFMPITGGSKDFIRWIERSC